MTGKQVPVVGETWVNLDHGQIATIFDVVRDELAPEIENSIVCLDDGSEQWRLKEFWPEWKLKD